MSSRSLANIYQQIAQLAAPQRADLHIHSSHSDGEFTVSQILERARKANLYAVAITDHDTLNGYLEAITLPQSAKPVEIISGVEITCEWNQREHHLLAYWVDPHHLPLTTALRAIHNQRIERFREMVQRLSSLGVSLSDMAQKKVLEQGSTLGRRHLAKLLIEEQHVNTVFEAFQRFLQHPQITSVPKQRIPLEQAIHLVHEAGGVTSLAHPSPEIERETLQTFQAMGLDAIEGEYPWPKATIRNRLRELATELNLGISGGSDCHGPTPVNRAIGHRGIDRRELNRLKELRRTQV